MPSPMESKLRAVEPMELVALRGEGRGREGREGGGGRERGRGGGGRWGEAVSNSE